MAPRDNNIMLWAYPGSFGEDFCSQTTNGTSILRLMNTYLQTGMT
ncbi:hypothetical protein CCACVL1_22585 [Corchorus capsularis]|uniref:Uncharacterized protein n=1 Tax=Corchorus capsularis TaxID=210143 RepID=A0A1R3GXN3_COCAP|nr:hypothetical protein CCACVL1_22585 [Corchorus capsularis]